MEQLHKKYANTSISTGTLLTENLVETTLSFLHAVKEECAIDDQVDLIQKRWDALYIEPNQEAIVDGQLYSNDTNDYQLADQEAGDEVLQDIIDLLTDIAPQYCYFGTHIGDGADFGFWIAEESAEDLIIDQLQRVWDDHGGTILQAHQCTYLKRNEVIASVMGLFDALCTDEFAKTYWKQGTGQWKRELAHRTFAEDCYTYGSY